MSTPSNRRGSGLGLLVVGLALGAGGGWYFAGGRSAAPAASDGHGSAAASAPSASAPAAERKVLYWYDPMAPAQRFDKPGKSPFMDMQLVPRYADEAAAGPPGAASGPDNGPALAVSAHARQALGMRQARVERGPIGAVVEAVGTVQLNEREVSIVQARTAGFVERVYARAPGDVIAAGTPLVDLLNPDWLGAQQEYLAVKATGEASLIQAVRQRLLLLGMTVRMVDEVDRSGRVAALQTVTAPAGGVITELMVRNGMAVAPGMTLARINGLGTVWLEAALPEALAATLRPGQAVEARFPALPGEVVRGRVAAILPEANRDTRTLRLRIELPNPERRLQAGLFAQVSLRGASRDALTVPAEAVIRTGRRALVYLVESEGRYRPVPVEIGEQVDERLIIRSGLTEGQQVVASGQFLIDSEASLQGVLARAPAPAGAEVTAAPASTTSAPLPAAAEYRSRGVVVAIEADSLTLDHQAVPALKWPAMTMPFKLAEPALARGLKLGQAVDFSFIQRGDDAVLTRLTPAAGAPK